ncbi:MAG: hypothetical protein EA357_03715 [Micavibrio sp.]|nr:MAG: hypothetical protein EA357_03715 [Micavibrio sp.]
MSNQQSICQKFNAQRTENVIEEFLKTCDPSDRLANLHNDLRSLPPARIAEWLHYHSYTTGGSLKEDDLSINFTEAGLSNLAQYLGNLDISKKGSAVAVYMATEFLYVLTENGNRSPVLPKIAEAVGSLSEREYQNPIKLRDTLCQTIQKHLDMLQDIRDGKKFPPNPFAKHENEKLRHYKPKAYQK